MCGDVFFDPRDERLVAVNVHQLQIPEKTRRAGEMDVIVVEPWRDERALQVDQSRVFALQRQHFFVAAYFDDTIAAHGDCLGLRLRLVDGPDEAVMQNQVGGFGASLAGGGRSVGRSLKSETER